MCSYRSIVFNCGDIDISQGSVTTPWGVMGSLVTVLLQMFS